MIEGISKQTIDGPKRILLQDTVTIFTVIVIM